MSENRGEKRQLSVIDLSKKGRQKFRSRRYQEACDLFSQGLEREPDNPYLLSGMGDACREIGNFEEAERCYRHLLEIDKNNLFALRGLGDVCKKLGRHQEAIRLWNQYLNLRPRDKHVMTRIADSCKALLQFDKAEEAYRQIIKFDPRDRFALTGMADLQHRLGHDEKAIEYYEKVLQFDPNELHILTIIGKLCWRINKFEKAESFFRRALSIDPHNPYALYGLGNCFRWHHQYDKAIEIWQEILKHNEGTQALFTRMGDAHMHLGDIDKAEASYLKAMQLGDDPFAVAGLVRLYCDKSEFPQAAKFFWILVADEDDAAPQIEELVKRFVRSGQRDVMLQFFRLLLADPQGGERAIREIEAMVERLEGEN
ncbi:Tetratricopeptide repeat-containing protein [Malonomonas rubra DSM 5091]|uniref:Tetratricopeptide repeat-containing protein n=1 Tax=Malonomonas rubra DSM 5091 TaxID=1122189 RepID=A0A1M6BGL4_MALRU|nr:tetratricopeptide repeat protein [Malonomonas rubra]SHI47920.1 Tetratricopeptide repeat-containing protein [Malonomonas rubra DSM 5091]